MSDFPSVSISEIPTGIIKLKNNGDFFIANEGRRPIYIDGRPVLSGNKWKLNNNSVVEVGNAPLPSETNTSSISLLKLEQRVCVVQIAGLRFVFLINLELISLIKAEAAKMTQQ
jgi:microspherule protein 1